MPQRVETACAETGVERVPKPAVAIATIPIARSRRPRRVRFRLDTTNSGLRNCATNAAYHATGAFGVSDVKGA